MTLTKILEGDFRGNVSPKPLEQLAKKLKILTKHNNTTESYIAIAKFLDEKELLSELEDIKKERDRVGHNPNHERTYAIYKELMKIGAKKIGKDDWNKFVYKNT